MRRTSPLSWLGWLYILLIALWLPLRAVFSDQLWWLAIVNTIAEYLFLPLPFLLVGALWRRRWKLLIGLGLPALACAMLFGELFVPALARAPEAQGPLLTAMTFNVLWNNHDSAATVESIRAAAPDIVGFQELTRTKKDALRLALEADYPYHTLASLEQVEDVGLMSRFPIESVTPVSLPPLNHALHAIVRVDGQRLHVFVVHLTPNHLFNGPATQIPAAATHSFADRAGEVARLEQELRGVIGPALLLCDCNLTDTSAAHAHLSRFLTDSFREAGWGLGHTLLSAGLPFAAQRVDYVWHTDGLLALAAEVGAAGGSDHLPLVVRLRLTEKA
jgi:vancomycin resistance protein VanJ